MNSKPLVTKLRNLIKRFCGISVLLSAKENELGKFQYISFNGETRLHTFSVWPTLLICQCNCAALIFHPLIKKIKWRSFRVCGHSRIVFIVQFWLRVFLQYVHRFAGYCYSTSKQNRLLQLQITHFISQSWVFNYFFFINISLHRQTER